MTENRRQRLSIADSGLEIADSLLWIGDWGLRRAD
jgi:hypothetical protein